MRSLLRSTIPTVLLLLLLGACGGASDDAPLADDPSDPDQPGVDGPDEDPAEDGAGGSDPLLGPEIEVAMEDVTERAEVPREDVEIVVTELVTWPDGALGCPEPDMSYTQALVEGYRIVLRVNGEEYHYHGAAGEDPRFCASPEPPVE